MAVKSKPRILVLSSLFPSKTRPQAGLFIRERMFRVGRLLPITVVSPQPWFPFQSIIRLWRSHFRPDTKIYENQNGFSVYCPKFFSLPGVAKGLDGWFMAIFCYLFLRRYRRRIGFDLIDAHFAYPDGFAAVKLGKWFNVPVTITLRGTEVPLSKDLVRRRRIIEALNDSTHIFSVSNSLKQHAVSLGVNPDKITVIGNGVDSEKFYPINKKEARKHLHIPNEAKVLVTVGALVPRKGQCRVIEVLPKVLEHYPDLVYLIVGGGSPEGDYSAQIKAQAAKLGVERNVRLLGAMSPEQLKMPLSAADVFVLATSNEGWANVFLEAMACGLPIVTTDVGGNREVVCRDDLGIVIPFGNVSELERALIKALEIRWDRKKIIEYSQANLWESRVNEITKFFEVLTGKHDDFLTA